jgi:predicted ribosomally synthesized peptide with nif11-like leader
MSEEHVKKFTEAMEKDAALREEVKKASDQVVEAAKKHGYHFTREELHDHLKEKWGAHKLPPSDKSDNPNMTFLSHPPRY